MPIGDLTGGPNGGESHWVGGGVSITSIDYFCRRRQPTRCDETQLTGSLFLLLGCTLFVDKSGSKIRPQDIVEALESDSIHEFSWGSVVLAYLYRQLGMASRYSCLGIAGCLTLLKYWIYEYFPCFRPHRERHVIGPGYPRSILWNASEVDWMPYRTDPSKDVSRTLMVGCIRYRDIVEPYMPDRSLCQLGRVQVVPMDILAPEFAMRPGAPVKKYSVKHSAAFADWAWRNFPYSTVLHLENYDVVMDPGKSAPDYLLWYTHHSHPRLLRDSQTSSHHGGPDRSDTEQWVRLFVHAYEPILRDREKIPSAGSRQACDEVERLISMLNRMLGDIGGTGHDDDDDGDDGDDDGDDGYDHDDDDNDDDDGDDGYDHDDDDDGDDGGDDDDDDDGHDGGGDDDDGHHDDDDDGHDGDDDDDDDDDDDYDDDDDDGDDDDDDGDDHDNDDDVGHHDDDDGHDGDDDDDDDDDEDGHDESIIMRNGNVRRRFTEVRCATNVWVTTLSSKPIQNRYFSFTAKCKNCSTGFRPSACCSLNFALQLARFCPSSSHIANKFLGLRTKATHLLVTLIAPTTHGYDTLYRPLALSAMDHHIDAA
ncbi:Replicase polyprotein 1a [Bienertia sinuspersici]